MDSEALLHRALLIRRAEERILSLFAEGKVRGTTHTCLGQELSGLAVAAALRDGDEMFSTHRGHGHFLARTGDLKGFIAELMGRRSGVCGGLGGSQHLFSPAGIHTSGIQGSLMPVSAGRALAMRLDATGHICAIFIGDGTLGEGVVYEALNIASIWDLPLLTVVEDNRYAQSTRKEQTTSGSVEGRAKAFNIDHRRAATWEWESLLDTAREAVKFVRAQRRPLVLEVETYRLAPHSKGDDHRDAAEIAEYAERDPLTKRIHEGGDGIAGMIESVDREIDEAVALADAAEFADADGHDLESIAPVCRDVCWSAPAFESERVAVAVHQALAVAFEQNPSLMMIGEDVEAPYGGAFKISRDMSERFPGRVRNTPISEAAIVGTGVGLALGGHPTLVEIMFGDFLSLAFDQIVNVACKLQATYHRQVEVPLIVRTPMGGKRGYGPTHSQSIEKHLLGVPGLTVLALNDRLCPARVYERLLETLSAPTLVIENKLLYTRFLKTDNPSGFEVLVSDERFPTVRIAPVDEDPDLTVVCYGGMLDEVEAAVGEAFFEDEIICEIVCPTLLQPFNVGPIVESASRTARVLVVEEGPSVCALGSEVMAQLAERGVALDAAGRLGYNYTIPASSPLELRLLPNKESVLEAIRSLCNE